MPITVRKFNAQVKDPETGDMIPAGLLSSDALGAINSAKTDAVAAVEGKQAVAEAAVELKGQTTLASIPDDYTSLSNEVDEVKESINAHDVIIVDADLFRQGNLNSSGNYQSSQNAIYTPEYIPDSAYALVTADNYRVVIHGYDDNGHVGYYNGSEFVTTAYYFRGFVKLPTELGYKYKFTVLAPTNSTAITPSEGNHVEIHCTTDPTLTKIGKAADAKAVGDALAKVDLIKTGVDYNIASDSVAITGANYSVIFTKATTTQGYKWDITSLSGKGNNMFPAEVDIVGVIQFVGGSNFMGGVHGNESNFEFRIMESGNNLAGTGNCNEIHIIMNSHLYDPDNTSNNVVDRYVEFVFTRNGWTCRNTFKILVEAQIQVAYCSGLFAFTASDCDGAYTNVGTLNLSSTASRQLESEKFKEITINLPDDFTVNIHSDTADVGWVTYRSNTQSFKVYFANAQLESVQAGTFITGKCEYRF